MYVYTERHESLRRVAARLERRHRVHILLQLALDGLEPLLLRPLRLLRRRLLHLRRRGLPLEHDTRLVVSDAHLLGPIARGVAVALSRSMRGGTREGRRWSG